MGGEFERRLGRVSKGGFKMDGEYKVTYFPHNTVTLQQVRGIVEEARRKFPCTPCLDLDIPDGCQKDLIEWFERWFGSASEGGGGP